MHSAWQNEFGEREASMVKARAREKVRVVAKAQAEAMRALTGTTLEGAAAKAVGGAG